MSGTQRSWWQRGVIYQIYPRSFHDSNNDGIGDLDGIRRRLDHLAWLGVDALWMSPIYPSPMADGGYDIADYTAIDPCFGTLETFDSLLADAHARGLRVILDFVPNHTSGRHPWFLASRSGRNDPRRDWYIWRDPAPGGGPPNNWLSNFGGSAWEWDMASGQYYYHAFLREQPDLNWRNPAVRAAMYDVLRFWLRRGVDGFRVDVIWHLIKDAALRDNPPNPAWREGDREVDRLLAVHSADQPEVLEVVAEMRAVIDEFPDRVLIGEIYLPVERLVAYYGRDLSGAHLPFNFQLILAPWQARGIARLIEEYERVLPPGGWPNWVLGNHDQSRVASRVGEAQARVAAMLLLALRGTPTLYYGDEIGMADVPVPPWRLQDEWAKREPGKGRDPYRTPMRWDGTANAGFSSGTPWLPVGDDGGTCNVAALAADDRSILSLHRRLIALRRDRSALAVGPYRPVAAEGDVLAWKRGEGAEEILVALNLGHAPASLALPGAARLWTPLLCTHLDDATVLTGSEVRLRPDEGVILVAAG